MFQNVVFDVETDGLLAELTRIHCLCLRDLDTGELMSCTDDDPKRPTIAQGLAVLAAAERAYGHNVIKFDLPAILKVYPSFVLKGRLLDTLVVAQFRWAHQKAVDYEEGNVPKRFIGSHMLEAWGYRLGIHKGEYKKWCEENGIEEPFAIWREEMQIYCDLDTEVTRALVLKIKEAGVPAEALETEHELAEYLKLQEENGWPFDMDKAIALYGKLSARREELVATLIEKFGSWQAKDGQPVIYKRDRPALGIVAGVPFQKYKTVQFNPKSNQHIEKCLREHYGWKPSSFTPSGQAEITEDTLEALAEIPEAAAIHEFLTIQKRIAMLAESKKKTSWMEVAKLNPITGMYHIHGRVKQNHAATHRASHVSPNVAQVPKVLKGKVDGVEQILLALAGGYGAECRELFTVPKGWVQVGADASGLELRCLAHYMARWDKGAYGELVLHGDIHTANMKAAGLKTRDEAKTFIYAWLYGEGDIARGAKFVPKGSSDEVKRRKGKKVSANFLRGLPALANLKEFVDKKLVSKGGPGYLRLPDLRRCYIKAAHSALNYLLQGAGAIICKRWIVQFNRKMTAEFGPQGWNGQWVALGWIHDEVQLAVRPEIAARVQEILVESIRDMTAHFNWRCPLDGEAKVGANWKETH